jgi:putative endonuclease
MEERSGPAEPSLRNWMLYVLRCGDGTLYAGITTDLERRLAAHAAGRGARYTRGRAPLDVVACWPYPDEPAVRRAEARFKRLPRERKLGVLSSYLPP